MALIKCPECGKEVSSNAASCPNCGYPIAGEKMVDKKIPVRFHREKRFKNGGCSGTVTIDGYPVGSASNGASFVTQLSVGDHNVLIQSTTVGSLSGYESTSETITIPSDAKSVDVELVAKTTVTSFLGGGLRIVIQNITINR